MLDNVKAKHVLYKMMICQLLYDKLVIPANTLAKFVDISIMPLDPSPKLAELLEKSLLIENENHVIKPSLSISGVTPVAIQQDYISDKMLENVQSSPIIADCKDDPSFMDQDNTSSADTIPTTLEATSPKSIDSDKEYSDSQIDFLLKLDLIPTPLVKGCPKTTQKWLNFGTVLDQNESMTGINAHVEDLDFQYDPCVASFETTETMKTASVKEADPVLSQINSHSAPDFVIFKQDAQNQRNMLLDASSSSILYPLEGQTSNILMCPSTTRGMQDSFVSQIKHSSGFSNETSVLSAKNITPCENGTINSSLERHSSILNGYQSQRKKCDILIEKESEVDAACTILSLQSARDVLTSPVSTANDILVSPFAHVKDHIYSFPSSFHNDFCSPTIANISTKETGANPHSGGTPEEGVPSSSTYYDKNSILVSYSDHSISNSSAIETVCKNSIPMSNLTSSITCTEILPRIDSSVAVFNIQSDHIRKQEEIGKTIGSGAKRMTDIETGTDYKTIKEVVLNEIHSQEITQAIFAKAAINKSQGYLSDLLRSAVALSADGKMRHGRALHTLEKVFLFLKMPEKDRKMAYVTAKQILSSQIAKSKATMNESKST